MKLGTGQADEADERGDVVADRVLAHGRVDPDGQRERPRDEDRPERERHRQPQPVADHGAHGLAPLHGHAELAAQHEPHPAHVLHPHRLVQAVLLAQRLDELLRHDG